MHEREDYRISSKSNCVFYIFAYADLYDLIDSGTDRQSCCRDTGFQSGSNDLTHVQYIRLCEFRYPIDVTLTNAS